MRPAQFLALCALSVSANAFASSFDSLDLYFANGEIETAPGGKFDHDGFGAKFRGSIGEDFFFAGEYQNLRNSEQADSSEWRLGLGLPLLQQGALTAYGLVEYINADIEGPADIATDGAGAHIGLLFNPWRALSLYGQAGYIGLREADGYEWLAGAAIQLKRWGGVFAEYRDSSLNVDASDADLDSHTVRAGVYLLVTP